jgi:hypothetical protein
LSPLAASHCSCSIFSTIPHFLLPQRFRTGHTPSVGVCTPLYGVPYATE